MSYKIFDGATIAFTAVEQAYAIGTGANAAISGSWPAIGEGVPHPTKQVRFYATQDVLLRFVVLEAYLQQVGGTLLPGLFVQQFYPANVWHEVPVECIAIYIVRNAVDGTLYLNAYA